MAFLHTAIITFTQSLIRHPKPFILVPILVVFLLSYDTLYRTTLFHTTYFFQQKLPGSNGLLLDQLFQVPAFDFDFRHSNVTRLTISSNNALSVDALRNLSALEETLPSESCVLSPLGFLSPQYRRALSDTSDPQLLEKSLLQLFNYKMQSSVFRTLFCNWTTFNQIIVSAQKLSVYVFTNSSVSFPADSYANVDLVTEGPSEAEKLSHYWKFLLEIVPGVKWANILARSAMLVALSCFSIHLYVSVCNCHKIRSSIGLLLGWATSICTAYFAALNIQKRFSYPLLEWSVLGPATWQLNAIGILCVMLISSRTFYRTLHDLAGDNTFGELESLHKRVIKYYLGVNISEQNSEGIFWVSQFLKGLLRLNKQETYPVPIPNVTIILLINLFGFSLIFCLCGFLISLLLNDTLLGQYWITIKSFYMVITVALVIDHVLQLTFIAAIVIIDLNRVELSDMLSHRSAETTSYHEENPISALLLSWKGEKVAKDSLRHRLGTHLLKIRPSSSSTYWLYTMPSICLSITCMSGMFLKLAFSNGISGVLTTELAAHTNFIYNETTTYIYYLELGFIVLFIVAVCEVSLYYNFAKIMPDDTALDLQSEIAGQDQTKFFNKLLENESKKFESITLGDTTSTNFLKVYSNPKCPFLVSVDLDNRYFLWEPKKSSASKPPTEITPRFNLDGGVSTMVNHVEISDGGDYVIFINFQACRIKCYETKTGKYTWEVSLSDELVQPLKRMKTVATFFRKRTVVGFLARELLSRKQKDSRRGSEVSISSNHTWSGHYAPPSDDVYFEGLNGDTGDLNREEFIAILETGEMLVIMTNKFKIQSFNLLSEVYFGHESIGDLTIVSSKYLASARVSDRIVCNLSNNDIIVGTAIKNTWRFQKLELNKVFKPHKMASFAPTSMTRGRGATAFPKVSVPARKMNPDTAVKTIGEPAVRMNKSTIVTVEFVGMFVRVNELKAEMVDIQSGTILRVFHIGSFKPGTFKVAHSEPTHCKFCGCASVESLTLLYEDLYDKTLILHTFKLQNSKSRNNICLRVERDPREVRCMGLDSAIESHYWYTNIEQWDVTDMNVIIGIKRESDMCEDAPSSIFDSEPKNQSSLRRRKVFAIQKPRQQEVRWQGFVVTASNGKFLEFQIPGGASDAASSRPNFMVKYGYKAVAVVFGSCIRILYLGNDKLIENDLYYSGTTSSLSPSLLGLANKTKSSDLLFIRKRRGNRSRMPTNSLHTAAIGSH